MILNGFKELERGYVYESSSSYTSNAIPVLLGHKITEGDEKSMLLMGLKRFTKGYTINPKKLRREVAAKLIEENRYCF